MIDKLSSTLLAVFLASLASTAQTTTSTNCTINQSSPSSANANCNSTSVDQNAESNANEEAGAKLGQGVGNLIAMGIRSHESKKNLKQYCKAHPGEPYQMRLPNGTVTSAGTCEGVMSADRSRELLNQNLCVGAIKAGKACYVVFSGDVLTEHSERASAIRYHMVTSDTLFMAELNHAGIRTFVYTNDSDQKFTYDVVAGRDIPPGESAKDSQATLNSGR